MSSKKTEWASFNEGLQKQFSPFMINRWLSMDQNLVGIVAYTQQYTMDMPKDVCYNFYKEILPKKKLYLKYIKSQTEKDKKYQKVIEHLSQHFSISQTEAAEYIEMLLQTGKQDELKEFVQKFGYTEKEVNNLFK